MWTAWNRKRIILYSMWINSMLEMLLIQLTLSNIKRNIKLCKLVTLLIKEYQ